MRDTRSHFQDQASFDFWLIEDVKEGNRHRSRDGVTTSTEHISSFVLSSVIREIVCMVTMLTYLEAYWRYFTLVDQTAKQMLVLKFLPSVMDV